MLELRLESVERVNVGAKGVVEEFGCTDFDNGCEADEGRVELGFEDASELRSGVLGDVDADLLWGDGFVRRGGAKALCQRESRAGGGDGGNSTGDGWRGIGGGGGGIDVRTSFVDTFAEVLEGGLFVLGPAVGAFDGDALVFIPLAARSRETSVCGRPEQFLHLQELTAPSMSHAACSINSFVDRKRILLPVLEVRDVRSELDRSTSY